MKIKFIIVQTGCIRLEHAKPEIIQVWIEEVGMVPPVDKNILATDSFWKKESQLSLSVQPQWMDHASIKATYSRLYNQYQLYLTGLKRGQGLERWLSS